MWNLILYKKIWKLKRRWNLSYDEKEKCRISVILILVGKFSETYKFHFQYILPPFMLISCFLSSVMFLLLVHFLFTPYDNNKNFYSLIMSITRSWFVHLEIFWRNRLRFVIFCLTLNVSNRLYFYANLKCDWRVKKKFVSDSVKPKY